MATAPLGHLFIYEAVAAVLRAQQIEISIASQDDLRNQIDKDPAAVEQSLRLIGEACEGGKLVAGYETRHREVDALPQRKWHGPNWVKAFRCGKMDLDLPWYDMDGVEQPVIDHRGRPNTARCERLVFIRKDSLEEFVKGLRPVKPAPIERGKRLSRTTVVSFVSEYMTADANPTSDGLESYARQRGVIGSRDLLRAEYRKQIGHAVRPGRRHNPPK